MDNTGNQVGNSGGTSDQAIQTQVKMAQLVFFALCASIFMYGLVVFQKPQTSSASLGDVFSDPIAQPLILMSFVTLFLSRVIPKIILKQALSRVTRPQDGTPVPAVKVFGPWFTYKIIQWALSESIALFGFVLAFMKYGWIIFIPFAAVSLALMLMSRPRADELKQLMNSI